LLPGPFGPSAIFAVKKDVVAIGVLFQAFPSLVQGMIVTLQVLFYSAILAFIFSFVAGFGRLSKWRPVR
jgi:polar amino acid transport system permease protein